MITKELLSMLWCPSCEGGELTLFPDSAGGEATELRCSSCDGGFPIRLGYPILIPSGALTGPEWEVWQSHLEKLQARRAVRVRRPEHPINRLAQKSQPHPGFAEFIGIDDGVVLDLGCGPGKFRTVFDPTRVRYVGLDPLALPDVDGFDFVQGVSEYLPFKAGSFTDIVILAALDHFRDLDKFFAEAERVLGPGGRLHILQSVHEVRGPVSAVKVVAHRIKDSWEDRHTAAAGSDAPKHIEEFTRDSLLGKFSAGGFKSVASASYSATWYSPVKLFMSFQREGEQAAARATA